MTRKQRAFPARSHSNGDVVVGSDRILSAVEEDPGFAEWVSRRPYPDRGDAVWRTRAYQLGTYVAERSWADVSRLARVRQTRSIADQLYRAVGSVPANIAEGFSRSSPRDRCRFYEYALGSAREACCWYDAARPIVGADRTRVQQEILRQVVRLLLRMISTDRRAG